LSRNDFLAFPVPPLTSRRTALVNMLSSLEAKIEANSRLVRLLRNLAVAMLQQAADPAARFVVNLVADVRKGLSYTGAGLADEGMAMVNLANAENFGWFKRSGLKYYTGVYKPRHVASPGSLLVSGVDLTWRLAIIGWPMLLPEDVGPALFSHHIFLVDFRPEWDWLRLPLWAHLYANNVRAHLEGMVYGTTVATLPAEALTDLEFSATPRDAPALSAANDLIRRAWAAERETKALSALRDTLLPPLLSGELRFATRNR
jgi:type I restriction enzyme, S subunit